MKRMIIILVVALLAMPVIAQNTGLFLEFGVTPQSVSRAQLTGDEESIGVSFADCDVRIATGVFGVNALGEGGVLGAEFGQQESGSYLGVYAEDSYSLRVWKKLGIRGGYRKGACYLFDQERAGLTTGASASVFWTGYELIGTYTAITYVRDSIIRSTSSWYVGVAVSLFWP